MSDVSNHDDPPGERLEGWREIGSHIGRSARTAQRWNKTRGLPVRRIPGPGRDTIIAYTGEIDAWLEEIERLDRTSDRRRRRLPDGRFVILALMAIAATALVLGLFLSRSPVSGIDRIDYAVARDGLGDGRYVGMIRGIDEVAAVLDFANEVVSARLVRRDDGTQGVLIGFGAGGSRREGTLALLDLQGVEQWLFDLYEPDIMAEARGERLDVSDYLYPTDLFTVRIDERSLVVIVAQDRRNFVSRVTLLDLSSGSELGSYWHDGKLGYGRSVIEDIDADGLPELLVSGHSNALWGHWIPQNASSAIVMAFDLERLIGIGASQSWPRRRWHSMPIHLPKWYQFIPWEREDPSGTINRLETDRRPGTVTRMVVAATQDGRLYKFDARGDLLAIEPTTLHLRLRNDGHVPPAPKRVTHMDVAITECLDGNFDRAIHHLNMATGPNARRADEWRTRCAQVKAQPVPGSADISFRQLSESPPVIESIQNRANSTLAAGDAVVAVGGTPIEDGYDFLFELRRRAAGSVVPLRISRSGKTLDLTIRLRRHLP